MIISEIIAEAISLSQHADQLKSAIISIINNNAGNEVDLSNNIQFDGTTITSTRSQVQSNNPNTKKIPAGITVSNNSVITNKEFAYLLCEAAVGRIAENLSAEFGRHTSDIMQLMVILEFDEMKATAYATEKNTGELFGNIPMVVLNYKLIRTPLLNFVTSIANKLLTKGLPFVNVKMPQVQVTDIEQFNEFIHSFDPTNFSHSIAETIASSLTPVLIHELTHVIQIKKDPENHETKSYVAKRGETAQGTQSNVSSGPMDKRTVELYLADQREIPAFAHNSAVSIIRKSKSQYRDLKSHAANMQAILNELSKTGHLGMSKDDNTEHYYQFFRQNPKPQYQKVYKRYIKILYTELKTHLDQCNAKLPLAESASDTTAANIGSVENPVGSLGKNRKMKAYSGSPGKSGTKVIQTKTLQPKKKDGTAVNALDIKGKKGNLFGAQMEGGDLFTGGTIKRS
jgi:hypothetical protein